MIIYCILEKTYYEEEETQAIIDYIPSIIESCNNGKKDCLKILQHGFIVDEKGLYLGSDDMIEIKHCPNCGKEVKIEILEEKIIELKAED